VYDTGSEDVSVQAAADVKLVKIGEANAGD